MKRDAARHLRISIQTEHPYEEEGKPEPLIFIENLNEINEDGDPWVVLWLRREEAISLKHKLVRAIKRFPTQDADVKVELAREPTGEAASGVRVEAEVDIVGERYDEDHPLSEDPEALARFFHDTYERLAPSFQYETRKESAVSWDQVPDRNKRLMIAVATEVQKALERG